ncbi:hypothetical protein CLHUN_37220 [Ruminiclostridium hungatei]|uniref:YcxB-like C-terminal domain-containing protein n=1 Tax=Ruminiclostridium hungatei TaxID=48256 RepID=A0A1V4SF42_RUMHU|nr:YcxB family protein [Ruminiclostridium hungatei]OPX42424.1 hypothetical protein CLHUN_37220 [Ruminiclostridium hungatei]
MYKSETVSVDVSLNEKDVLLCKYRLLLNKPKYGVMTGISVFSLIYIIQLFMTVGLSAINYERDISSHLPGVAIAVIFPIIIILILVKNWLLNKKEFNAEKIIRMNYFFSDFGITIIYKMENNISWNGISKVIESKNNFIIYPSENSLILIPKKYFKDTEQIEVLKNILTEKLPKKKLSLKKKSLYST